jgi:hypothetical protein
MIVRLRAPWIQASRIDTSIRAAGDPYGPLTDRIEFNIADGCCLLIDAVIRLLAFANQFSAAGLPVRIVFEEGRHGAMGYLNRMGFFDFLAPAVEVSPERPAVSGADVFRGGNDGLVEIEAINHTGDRYALPDKLSEKLRTTCAERTDIDRFEEAMATIFSELIDNVYEHSGTTADGYAALQAYARSNKVRVIVSDSGAGLMQTIRPALEARDPQFRAVKDVDLLVQMFRHGLSRLPDDDRGNGLSGCAEKAIRFKGNLEVRLETQNVRLVPSGASYVPSTAYKSTNLTRLAGTHIAFEFGSLE